MAVGGDATRGTAGGRAATIAAQARDGGGPHGQARGGRLDAGRDWMRGVAAKLVGGFVQRGAQGGREEPEEQMGREEGAQRVEQRGQPEGGVEGRPAGGRVARCGRRVVHRGKLG